MKNIHAILTAALIGLGITMGAANAESLAIQGNFHGGSATILLGGGHGGYYGGYHLDRDRYGERPRHPGGRRHGGHYGGYRGCQPGEAIEKAYRFGMRRPGIERVTRGEVIVSGRYHGDRAILVFDRYSRHCRIIASRGI